MEAGEIVYGLTELDAPGEWIKIMRNDQVAGREERERERERKKGKEGEM